MHEYSADEEREESRRWRVFRIGEQEHRVDMKAIEPYKRVISHGGTSPAEERPSSLSRKQLKSFRNFPQETEFEKIDDRSRLFQTCVFSHYDQILTVLWNWTVHPGYYGDGLNAIIVFAVCFMPESNQPNYRYIMENIFKWVSLSFSDLVILVLQQRR